MIVRRQYIDLYDPIYAIRASTDPCMFQRSNNHVWPACAGPNVAHLGFAHAVVLGSQHIPRDVRGSSILVPIDCTGICPHLNRIGSLPVGASFYPLRLNFCNLYIWSIAWFANELLCPAPVARSLSLERPLGCRFSALRQVLHPAVLVPTPQQAVVTESVRLLPSLAGKPQSARQRGAKTGDKRRVGSRT